MKKIWIIFVLLTSVILLLSGCGQENHTIKVASLLDTNGGFQLEPQIEMALSSQSAEAVFQEQLPIYEIDRDEKIYEKAAVLNAFGIKESAVIDKGIYGQLHQAVLEIDRPHRLYYHRKENTEQEVGLDKAQLTEQATEFLRKHDLLADGFYATGKFGGGSVIKQDISGVQKEIVYSRTVEFQRKINGKEVYGASRIWVSFDSDGMSEVLIQYSPIKKEMQMKVVPLDKAVERVHSFKYTYETEVKEVESIHLTDVEVAYWDVPFQENLTHIQPVYVFSGEATGSNKESSSFKYFIPALEDKVIEKAETLQ